MREKNMKHRFGKKMISFITICGVLIMVPTVTCNAAVITSNATDKVAVVFDAATAYRAGDYVTQDGELYLCTAEAQGAWETVEGSFLQVTKNHELGESEELSALYGDGSDPASEKSVMAFLGNAWGKLKGFFGIGASGQTTDAANYDNSSVSAKLNYLKANDEATKDSLDTSLGELKNKVDQCFQSVSNGKTVLANTIAGEINETPSSPGTFADLKQAITDMSQKRYDTGYSTGHTDGYNTGKADGYNAGKTDGYNAGYSAGLTDGGASAMKTEMLSRQIELEAYSNGTFSFEFSGNVKQILFLEVEGLSGYDIVKGIVSSFLPAKSADHLKNVKIDGKKVEYTVEWCNWYRMDVYCIVELE